MMTKITTILLATAALGASAGAVLAQGPATPVPLTQQQPLFDYKQLPATQGTVKFFTMTPRGDVDGFVLADGTQVHFPPHMSSQLTAAVRQGDAVTVYGLKAANIPMIAAMAITGDASKQTVVDMGPHGGPDGGRFGRGFKHGPDRGGERGDHGPGHEGRGPEHDADRGPDRGGRPPRGGPVTQVSGKVMAVLHGPRGEANGAMLEDGTVLRLPPPEAARLAAMIAPGQTVVAQGRGIANNLGRMVEVRSIGASADKLTELAPPPHGGPRGERHGPPPGDAPVPPRP